MKYQVIQAVTFLSPNVGGREQPLKGSQKTIPKRSPAELPGKMLLYEFWGLNYQVNLD